MKDLTIENVTEVLLQRLVRRARLHRRSLNEEILAMLGEGEVREELDAQAFIERIRLHRPNGHERFTAGDYGADSASVEA